jgi:alanine racemase
MYIERGAWAEVNLDAIQHNVQVAKKSIKPTTKLCAVVKADAYGHGAVQVAQAADRAGANFFAVALPQEGILLRDAGIEKPILVLGLLAPKVADLVVKYNLSYAVFDEERLMALNEAALANHAKAKIHLAVDTGMHRIGMHVGAAGAFAEKAAKLPGIKIEGMFSHFATADESNKDFAAYQFNRFQEAARRIEAKGIHIPIKHIANSAAIAELPQYQMDMVRQGVTLYGMRPANIVKPYKNYRPAMVVKATVGFVKTLPAGAGIGYGQTFVTAKPSVIATVPIGYADGLNRALSNNGYMIIRGKHAPIVGRICMDQVMLDVTGIPDVKIGDEVTVFGGEELPFETVAKWQKTICYEITCALSPRLPRIYVRDK